MTSMLDNMPCIVGVAQQTWRAEDGDAPEPILMWEEISHQAVEDTGSTNILNSIDELDVVFSLSWQYDNACTQLANKLGLKDGARQLSGLSGTSPQHFLQQGAEKIIQGKRDAVLVVGGEALATKKRSKKTGRKLAWPKPNVRPDMPFDDPFHPSEVAHEVFQAYLTFAVLDSARRKNLGLSHEQNRRQQAQMMASLSQIAANNSNAWFHAAYQAEQLYNVTADNRMIAYPYTKNSVAIMDVDMAAATIITSHKKANDIGIPKDKRIYLRGWDYQREPIAIAERPQLYRSEAMASASQNALAMAGLNIDDIAYLDLYSCFASSINFAKDALGIKEDDRRALSITGGLPYFGGPGNNYLSHSVATMVEKLRNNPEENGLLNGVGMHMTNHVFGIYSAQPPEQTIELNTQAYLSDKLTIANEAEGEATIAAYSIVHDRENNWGLAICDINKHDLNKQQRCYARIEDQPLLAAMEAEEWVSKSVTLQTKNKVNKILV